jgi:hypothetical protein
MDLHAKDSDSRVEKILSATLGNYDKPLPRPQSRVEEYLMAIKDQGGGGGGGGTTDYNALDNKPSINGTTLQGDLTLEDIGAASNGSRNSYDAEGEEVTVGGSSGNTYDPDSESVVIGGL